MVTATPETWRALLQCPHQLQLPELTVENPPFGEDNSHGIVAPGHESPRAMSYSQLIHSL